MSAANTSTTPAPLDEQPAIIAPKTSTDNEGDSPNSSPGTSPSTWKPNADAAEWKPSFGSASADEIPDSGEGPDDANISLGSGAEGKQVSCRRDDSCRSMFFVRLAAEAYCLFVLLSKAWQGALLCSKVVIVECDHLFFVIVC